MSAGISRATTQENVSTSLASGITDVATQMTLGDASKLQIPTFLVIDRIDASGTVKATSLWEYVKVTNIVGNDCTITRGQGGSTQQSHSSGAIVEAVMTAALAEEIIGAVNPEHTSTGLHVIGTATVNYIETKRLAVTSVASIARLRSVENFFSNVTITGNFNISGASIVGIAASSGTGGLNALFQVPGGLASVANVGGLIPIPATFTGQFIQAYVQTPASVASVSIQINRNFAEYGVITILGGATFASSASIGTPALAIGDVLTLDIKSNASLATDLSLMLRAT